VTPALRFAAVRKRFGRNEALRGLNLEVPCGSLFGLIGPNGAGKTTAFSIACGFLRADAGQIEILGGSGWNARRLRGRLGALPQDAALARETRCLEHLVFFGRLQGMSHGDATREAERRLQEVGLGDRLSARTRTLSHGMLRRLAVAQALLGGPELVLLDEPTSGLDPRHAHELRELLRRERHGGRTILVSSHNLPELESLCDHVAFVDRGVVMAAGPTEEVTGKTQEVEIELGTGPSPIDDVTRALPGDQVQWDGERRLLRVSFAPAPGRDSEEVIGAALGVLLAGGARVRGVRRGISLEKRFLEMT